MLFVDNNIKNSFAGYGQGLVEFQGFQRLFILNCSFSRNGENILETTNYLRKSLYQFIPQNISYDTSPLAASFSYKTYQAYVNYFDNYDPTSQEKLKSYSISDPNYQMTSLIGFHSGSYLNIQSTRFDNCFLFETSNAISRGLVFYSEYLRGAVNITGSIITNINGMSSSSPLRSYLTSDLIEKSVFIKQNQSSPLMNVNWQNSKINQFIFSSEISNVHFQYLSRDF